MRIVFRATEAGFAVDEYSLVCGVSGADAAGEAHYLVLQRAVEGDDEDSGVHVEFDDQSNGDYGLVAGCRLRREALEVDLSGQLGGLVGVDGFDVLLLVDDESFAALQVGLPQVFRETLGVLRLA